MRYEYVMAENRQSRTMRVRRSELSGAPGEWVVLPVPGATRRTATVPVSKAQEARPPIGCIGPTGATIWQMHPAHPAFTASD